MRKAVVANLLAVGLIGLIVVLWNMPDRSDFFVLVTIDTTQDHKYLAATIDTKTLRKIKNISCEGRNGNDNYWVTFSKASSRDSRFQFSMFLSMPESDTFPVVFMTLQFLHGDIPAPSAKHPSKYVGTSIDGPVSLTAGLVTFLDKETRDKVSEYNLATHKGNSIVLTCVPHS